MIEMFAFRFLTIVFTIASGLFMVRAISGRSIAEFFVSCLPLLLAMLTAGLALHDWKPSVTPSLSLLERIERLERAQRAPEPGGCLIWRAPDSPDGDTMERTGA